MNRTAPSGFWIAAMELTILVGGGGAMEGGGGVTYNIITTLYFIYHLLCSFLLGRDGLRE